MPPARHPRSPTQPTMGQEELWSKKEEEGFFSRAPSLVFQGCFCAVPPPLLLPLVISSANSEVFFKKREEKTLSQQQRPIYENWVLLRVRAPCIKTRKRNDLRESSSWQEKKLTRGNKKPLISTVGRKKKTKLQKSTWAQTYTRNRCVC